MSKRKVVDTRKRRTARETAKEAETSAHPEANWLSSSAVRETIESVIIAFVLAFLFRTFEAEAFVIPTGSMAPTLMGKHKDVECPMCHYRYQANASDKPDGQNGPAPLIATTTCPMCRYTANVAPGNPQHENYESYDGDRILVAKFPYELADPARWDVVVFKYPGDSTMNYIKRLVGLPGETIRIQCGDLWIHKPGQKAGEFAIAARKPPAKILAMLQPVYDNDLAPTISGELHWPARWTAEPAAGDYAFGEVKDLSTFGTKGNGQGEAWIRYRHRVPTGQQWGDALAATGKGAASNEDRQKWIDLLKDRMPSAESVPPQLVSDFTAYNTARPERNANLDFMSMAEPANGLHWVGDLAVQCEVLSTSASGSVTAELVKGGRHFRCRFDLATGKAELAIGGGGAEAEKFHPTAATAVKGPGRHTIIFSNVDDELRLWVDPSWRQSGLVEFDAPTTYDSAKLDDHIPTADDLSPVGIGAQGAAVEISHIRVLRDIYYIALFTKGDQPTGSLKDFKGSDPDLADPADWPQRFSTGPDGNMRTVDIKLAAKDPLKPELDQFFVLGDNSAFSQDGRLWCSDVNWHGGKREWWVDRELFIGKALFIYWPHGWKIPYLPLPFNPVPNFSRMHLVR